MSNEPHEPAFPDGPPTWPVADEDVRAALEAAYADGSWGRYRGPNCERLIGALAEYHRVEHVTLCCSGTIAVELALRGLKIGADDEVLLAGYDFPGNFRAIEAVGARPALVDIDPATWCFDVERLEAAIASETRAVIVSHLHGALVPMRRLMEIAAGRGIAVVEDACQAPGAMIDGRRAGTWGDAGVLSFGGSKLLTAGRGGAVLTRSAEVHQRIKVFAERGNDAFALSELQAAVLVPQLAKLDDRNHTRRSRAATLLRVLGAEPNLMPLRPSEPPDEPVYYKLAWRLQRHSGAERDRTREVFVDAARRQGLAIDAGFRGFAGRGPRRCRQATSLENALLAANATVVLHHPLLLASTESIERAAEVIRDAAATLPAAGR